MADLQGVLDDASSHLKGTDNDNKVNALHRLEGHLRDVDDQAAEGLSATLDACAAVIKTGLRNGNPRVYSAALSCALALFQALGAVHSEASLRSSLSLLLPGPAALLAFLGDAREAIRLLARSVLLQAAKIAAALLPDAKVVVEGSSLSILDKAVKDQGLASKNAKVREQSLIYLSEVRLAYPSLPLRQWVPLLVAALEDPDPAVRDVARETVVTVFTAPSVAPAAKADLKKEMLKANVRKSTSDVVLRRVLGSGTSQTMTASASLTGSPSDRSVFLSNGGGSNGRHSPSHADADASVASATADGRSLNPTSQASANSADVRPASQKPRGGDRLLKQPKNLTQAEMLANIEAVAAANAAAPSTSESGVVQVVYIASARDLEEEFAAMQSGFAGKETEFNWQDRERSIGRVRGMLKGEAHTRYRVAFINGVKTVLEGILKAVQSLRTTLAASTCALLAELPNALKEGLLPFFEPIFSTLLKQASLTKKQIAQASQDAATAMLVECPYHVKVLPIIGITFDQKNVQARIYSIGHLKTMIEVQAPRYRDAFEASSLPQATIIIRKALADPNAVVRETARATFWHMNATWPSSASSLLATLDSGTRKAIERDPNSHLPTSQKQTNATGTKEPVRPSIRALISARRAAQEQTGGPDPIPALSSSMPASSSASNSRAQSFTSGNNTGSSSPPTARRVSMTPVANTGLNMSASSVSRSRPNSYYGPKATGSQIPSPRGSFDGTTRERKVSNTSQKLDRNTMSPVQASSPTPTKGRAARPTYAMVSPPQLRKESESESDSPPLAKMAGAQDYSDIEGSTFNIVPNGLESSDDESINLLNYQRPRPATAQPENAGPDTSEQSRILDGLMDTTFDSNDSIEVEEAVRVRAEQAEQTAHRFLELTEPDGPQDDTEAGGDTVILSRLDSSDRDIPVPSGTMLAATSDSAGLGIASTVSEIAHTPSTPKGRATDATTPLLQKLQAIHLKDSPAGARNQSTSALNASLPLQEHWWSAQAAVLLSRSSPLEQAAFPQDTLASWVTHIESGAIAGEDLLKVAATSGKWLSDDLTSSGASNSRLWSAEDLIGRLADSLCGLISRDQIDVLVKDRALIALRNIVTYQKNLLDSRELHIVQHLLQPMDGDRSVQAGREVVLLGLLTGMEPVYALSCLRTGLTAQKSSLKTPYGANRELSLSLGLKAMGSLFSVLPPEILEDEILRCRSFIMEAFSSEQPSLRQIAATVIVKAHEVLQDDTRLFELLEGLTLSQINLCTYLFARSGSNASH